MVLFVYARQIIPFNAGVTHFDLDEYKMLACWVNKIKA